MLVYIYDYDAGWVGLVWATHYCWEQQQWDSRNPEGADGTEILRASLKKKGWSKHRSEPITSSYTSWLVLMHYLAGFSLSAFISLTILSTTLDSPTFWNRNRCITKWQMTLDTPHAATGDIMAKAGFSGEEISSNCFFQNTRGSWKVMHGNESANIKTKWTVEHLSIQFEGCLWPLRFSYTLQFVSVKLRVFHVCLVDCRMGSALSRHHLVFAVLLCMFISCYHTAHPSSGAGSSTNAIWQANEAGGNARQGLHILKHLAARCKVSTVLEAPHFQWYCCLSTHLKVTASNGIFPLGCSRRKLW